MAQLKFDKAAEYPIVVKHHLNKRTPPEGACNTNRGLTTHAATDSMEATGNTSSELSSRQLLLAAVDGFFVGEVEFYPPSDNEVNSFVQGVCGRFGEAANICLTTTEIRQGFKQFLSVVINIQTKNANSRSGK